MNISKIITLFLILTSIQSMYAQKSSEISLLSGWVFAKGDDMEWKNPEFDDEKWEGISPVSYWEYLPEMEDYDGYAWYRIKVFIPSSLKENTGINDSLHIRLGRVDDNDQTFLNGSLIGENAKNASGNGNPEFAGMLGTYSKQRNYTIPLGDSRIKWDSINVIAVRAYDFYLTGGLCMDDHRIYVHEGWTDYISVERKTSFLTRLGLGEKVKVDFAIHNTSPTKKYEIDFFAEIILKESSKSVATFSSQLIADAKSDSITSIEFIPLVKTPYEISYRITNRISGQTIIRKDLLGVFSPNLKLLETPLQPLVKDKIKSGYLPPCFGDTEISGMLGEKMKLNLEKGLLNIPYQQFEPYLDKTTPPWPVGEFMGKLFHGQTKLLQYSRDERLFEIVNGIVEIWLEAQKENGYLGTNESGKEWEGWDVWDHKYLILALVHHYSITGYQSSLDAAKKIGDLLINTFGYEDGKRDIISGYHAGMANGSVLEPMVYLYKYTGEIRYLDFCNYIIKAFEQNNGPKIISELTQGSQTVLKVGNAKGYEMLSCIIGIVQLYKVTGKQELIDAAVNAWEDIHKNRLYITGTSTSYELFQEKGYLPAGENDNMGETCVTAHWMYLSKELFKLLGEPKYIDEIDKSLYNHLLAAQHPISGDVVYYAALQNKKWYMVPDMYIGPPLCCHFSLKRCLTEIPEFSFYSSENEIGVLLYNQSSASVKLKNSMGDVNEVKLDIQSEYPLNNKTKLTVTPKLESKFTLKLRVPDWCSSYKAEIGDLRFNGVPGQFLTINKIWTDTESINITMDSPLKILNGGKSYPDHFAVKYGNQVLAVDGAVNSVPDLDKIGFRSVSDPIIKPYAGTMPDDWIGKQAFTTNMIFTEESREVILVPFADASQTGGDIRVWIKEKK
jgi:DUF1680 family protein